MDGVQLCQGYKATMRRQYDFYQSVCRRFWYSLNQPRKDDRLSWPWIQPAVFNVGPLDWESNTLNTRSLLHNSPSTFCLVIYYYLYSFVLFVFRKWGVLNEKGVLVFHQKVAIKWGRGCYRLKWVENFGKMGVWMKWSIEISTELVYCLCNLCKKYLHQVEFIWEKLHSQV